MAKKDGRLKKCVNYFPFGMEMPDKKYSIGEGYRFGFNGKELDTEGMGGGGSTYDYGFRIYNPQIGRFLSVDPLTKSYPMLTPYQYASNNPIMFIDLDGLEGTPPGNPDDDAQIEKEEEASIWGRMMTDTFWEQTVPQAVGDFFSGGDAKEDFVGTKHYTNNGSTVEDKKFEAKQGTRILVVDEEVTEALKASVKAHKVKANTDNSSGDGRGSGNQGGTDWKDPKDVTKTVKDASELVTQEDVYDNAKDYDPENNGNVDYYYSGQPDDGHWSSDSMNVYKIDQTTGDTVETTRQATTTY